MIRVTYAGSAKEPEQPAFLNIREKAKERLSSGSTIVMLAVAMIVCAASVMTGEIVFWIVAEFAGLYDIPDRFYLLSELGAGAAGLILSLPLMRGYAYLAVSAAKGNIAPSDFFGAFASPGRFFRSCASSLSVVLSVSLPAVAGGAVSCFMPEGYVWIPLVLGALLTPLWLFLTLRVRIASYFAAVSPDAPLRLAFGRARMLSREEKKAFRRLDVRFFLTLPLSALSLFIWSVIYHGHFYAVSGLILADEISRSGDRKDDSI